MRTLATEIFTQVILGDRTTEQYAQAIKNGWEPSQEFVYNSLPTGKIVFQVLIRVVHFHPDGPQIAQTIARA